MVTEEPIFKISKQDVNLGSQPQTQNFFISNPNINNTKITESVPHNEVIKF